MREKLFVQYKPVIFVAAYELLGQINRINCQGLLNSTLTTN
jgi:hypothetical protein